MQTSRELVRRALTFQYPERIPLHTWISPWATMMYPDEVAAYRRDFPDDIGYAAANAYNPSTVARGDFYEIGTATDDWGCVFENLQRGVHGEVKAPILANLDDLRALRPPCETLPTPAQEPARIRAINDACRASDKFILASCCPRPWERYQFLRGTENAMIDVMAPDENVHKILDAIMAFYTRELEFWAKTDVDALRFMDDWGGQKALLIPPRVWRELFKPMYQKFADIAHGAGKFLFMHSDGFIEEILPDLVEVGVDALNAQLFCMDMRNVARAAKGRLTFWGEIDRQHVLPAPPQAGIDAVRRVAESLYDPAGGIIAQFEIGPGARLDTSRAIMETWRTVGIEGMRPNRAVIHMLNGDAMRPEFCAAAIPGDVAVCREALIDGVEPAATRDTFWAARAAFCVAEYGAEATDYAGHVRGEFEKLVNAPRGSEIHLWFGVDLFCQVNLWFILSLLAERDGADTVSVVYPDDARDEFSRATPDEMRDLFARRRVFAPHDIALGRDLWNAYTHHDFVELLALSYTPSPCFPNLRDLYRAEFLRHTDGGPDTVVADIIAGGTEDFVSVFKEFSRRQPVYGFGDTQLRKIYNRVMSRDASPE